MLTALVPYAYSAAAQVMLLVNKPQAFQGRRLARDAAIAALAFACSVWAVAGAGQDVIAKGFILLLAGIPIYLWLDWRKQRAQIPARADTVNRLRSPSPRRRARRDHPD